MGGVTSRETVSVLLDVPPDDVATHVSVVPAVSVAIVAGSHPGPDDASDSGSPTSQLTATSETYQPLAPSVPDTVDVMSGGVMSSVLGRHSHTPRYMLTALGAAETANPPPIGYQPKPAPPAIGCPASSVDDVQPAVDELWKL